MDQYEKVKDLQHIFIYSVWGRTGSTALQRILNSSKKVVIYGEPHYIIDLILETIYKLNNETLFGTHYQLLEEAVRSGRHDKFYANALGNRVNTQKTLAEAVATLLKTPPQAETQRCGYKEIRIKDIQILEYLKKLFPNSIILFVFREPADQWGSILQTINWWKYEIPNLKVFLQEYKRISDIYIEFAQKNNTSYFIRNSQLKSLENIAKLIELCNLKSFDKNLVDDKLTKTPNYSLSKEQEDKIYNSPAYKNYLKMKKISENFFQTL